MRIVIDGRYINDNFPGIGRYTYNLIRAWGALNTGQELVVIVNRRLQNRRFDLKVLETTPNCYLVDCSVPRFLPAELLFLPPLIRSLRPTVYLSPFFLRPYYLPCPCVISIHDVISLHFQTEKHHFLSSTTFRIFARAACRFSAGIVTVSHSSEKAIRKWYPKLDKPIYVTPLAADPCFRQLSSIPVDRMRHKYGLHHPYVLHVGSHLKHKNVSVLLFAWHRLTSSARLGRQSHQLVLAGGGNTRFPEIRHLVARLGIESSVRFLGDVEECDLAALYNGANLFVFPSTMEGFGLPVIEAMACGTPVICSTTDALREVSGDAAWHFDPENVSGLTEGIDRFLGSRQLQKSFGRKGLARSSLFTWEATAKVTNSVCQKVIQ